MTVPASCTTGSSWQAGRSRTRGAAQGGWTRGDAECRRRATAPRVRRRARVIGARLRAPDDAVTLHRTALPRRRRVYRQGPTVSPCARCAGRALALTVIVTVGLLADPVWWQIVTIPA